MELASGRASDRLAAVIGSISAGDLVDPGGVVPSGAIGEGQVTPWPVV
jgi:hypothetical protein